MPTTERTPSILARTIRLLRRPAFATLSIGLLTTAIAGLLVLLVDTREGAHFPVLVEFLGTFAAAMLGVGAAFLLYQHAETQKAEAVKRSLIADIDQTLEKLEKGKREFLLVFEDGKIDAQLHFLDAVGIYEAAKQCHLFDRETANEILTAVGRIGSYKQRVSIFFAATHSLLLSVGTPNFEMLKANLLGFHIAGIDATQKAIISTLRKIKTRVDGLLNSGRPS